MTHPVATRWTPIAGSAGSFDAWLALPPAGTGPGLLLLQEIFGVNEHIRTVAEQYALDGFVVLAPDVFWQQVPRLDIGYTPDDIQRGRALLKTDAPWQAEPSDAFRDGWQREAPEGFTFTMLAPRDPSGFSDGKPWRQQLTGVLAFGKALGNTSGALPYTLLIDRKGRIVRARLGQIRPAELRGWLDAQLGR